MKKLAGSLLALTVLILAALPSAYPGGLKPKKDKGDGKEKGKEVIQGTWALVSTVFDGIKAEGKSGEVEITKDKFIVRPGKGEKVETFDMKVDPNQKHISITEKRTFTKKGTETKEVKEFTLLGIYELKEGELKLCFGLPEPRKNKEGKLEDSSERPGMIEGKVGRILMTLKRSDSK